MKKIYSTQILFALSLLTTVNLAKAQTIPTPQILKIGEKYIEDFNLLRSATDAVYPSGWGAWKLTDAPPANPARTKVAIANIGPGNLVSHTAATTTDIPVIIYGPSGGDRKFGFKSYDNTDNCIVVALNTTNATNSHRVVVKFDAMVIRNLYGDPNSKAKDNTTTITNELLNTMWLQYRIGESGDFTNAMATVQNGTVAQTTAVTTPIVSNNITYVLPESCNGEASVQLRWVLQFDSGNDNNVYRTYRPTFALDNFSAEIVDVSTLPVELKAFKAIKENNKVKLSWETLAEKDNSHFEILHSTDGLNFTSINKIDAKGMASSYLITASQFANGNNYYKLMQYDFNGKATELGLQVVNFDIKTTGKDLLAVYPNPSKDKININLEGFKAGVAKVVLLDLQGKIIQQEQTVSTEENKVITIKYNKALPTGQYILKVISGGIIKTSKIQIL